MALPIGWDVTIAVILALPERLAAAGHALTSSKIDLRVGSGPVGRSLAIALCTIDMENLTPPKSQDPVLSPVEDE